MPCFMHLNRWLIQWSKKNASSKTDWKTMQWLAKLLSHQTDTAIGLELKASGTYR